MARFWMGRSPSGRARCASAAKDPGRTGHGFRFTARLNRSHRIWQRRLFHGKPNQVALLANVRGGVPPGPEGNRGDRMRAAFANTLTELAARDPRILLLTADLGYMALEPFAHKFPNRFINVGVAEQNMVGLATGLAEAGFIPFVYSIVTFAALRPYEFIRNGPILHRLPVRLVGVGGGFEYGPQGASHHGLGGVRGKRVQPGIGVIAPGRP